jgi:electron transfer flavoprotein alpha subunit
MKVLVIADNTRGNLSPSTFNTINAAASLEGEIDVVVFDKNAKESAAKISGVNLVSSVKVCDSEKLHNSLAEPVAEFLSNFIQDNSYTNVFMASTSGGKNILPRVSALLDTEMLSDVISVIDTDTYKRPIYAGNAIATVKNSSNIQIVSIRTTAFDSAKIGESQDSKISEIDFIGSVDKVKFVDVSSQVQERPDLGSAKVVVSGGRGLQSKDNFKIIEKLADKLNAAIGASRAAVDAGFVANDLQVGQTGKVVAPDLYIAVGISGAIQHIAGMKESKVIVAINKDPEAPIFQIATYGLVGDLFEIVPELSDKLG